MMAKIAMLSLLVWLWVGSNSAELCLVERRIGWGLMPQFSDCALNKSWEELAIHESSCTEPDGECTFEFHTGGLGSSVDPGRFHAWVCVKDDPCAEGSPSSYFCYVFSEENEIFIPWHTNANLSLVPESSPPVQTPEPPLCDDWPSVFDLEDLGATGMGFTVVGPPENVEVGLSVSPAGDINGDGVADMVVGSVDHGNTVARAWVVFGNASPFPAEFELDTLDGTNGFVIVGIEKFDEFAGSVSAAGDVNGDGVGDLLIGASGSDEGSANAGSVYVIFGRTDGFPEEVYVENLDGVAGFAIHGASSNDYLGLSVSGTGDVNGDGMDDLVVGNWGYDLPGTGGSAQGGAHVLYGRSLFPAVVELSDLTDQQGFHVMGVEGNSKLGASVGWAGDVNQDGYDDVVVGAYLASPSGRAYVIFGSANGHPGGLSVGALDGSNGFEMVGARTYSRTGFDVDGAGDVNGDGFDDIVLGAPYMQSEGKSTAGEVFVVYGRANFSESMALGDLENGDGTDGFVIRGADAGDQLGFSVAWAGDMNGDEVGDVVLGAPNVGNTGGAWVVFGGEELGAVVHVSALDGRDGFLMRGESNNDDAGEAVRGRGGWDVNGDGRDDLLIGARNAGSSPSNRGHVYVVYGKAQGCALLPRVGADGSSCEDKAQWQACLSSRCCADGLVCYEQNEWYAQCLERGECVTSNGWSCAELTPSNGQLYDSDGDGYLDNGAPVYPANGRNGQSCGDGHKWSNCLGSRCCEEGLVCYEQNQWYAQCLSPRECTPGHWSCDILYP
mmetsp:Transcript_61172/g.126311  ORF Transcript_61172/g.126311 Transcript_61172/m.126311 type:complete len:780 (+) Transcript_61172:94-2433(+)